MFRTFKYPLLVAAATLINISPAFAEPATAQNVSVVSTTGLDLSSRSGQAKLDHRLVTAAYEVCGAPSDADLVGKNQASACRQDVLEKARAETRQLASRSAPIRIAAAR